MKTALVTGGSSGIGRCTAAALKNAGFTPQARRQSPLTPAHWTTK